MRGWVGEGGGRKGINIFTFAILIGLYYTVEPPLGNLSPGVATTQKLPAHYLVQGSYLAERMPDYGEGGGREGGWDKGPSIVHLVLVVQEMMAFETLSIFFISH